MELNEEEVQWEVAGTVSSVEGFVTTPSAFTEYRTHAHHPKELDDGKSNNDQHGVGQNVLYELLQLGLTTLSVKLVRLVRFAIALW